MKRHNRALILIALQLTALVGHASRAGNSQPASDRQIVDLPIEFIWTHGKELPPAMRPWHLALGLGVIPGGFHAHGMLPFVETPSIGHQTSIPLDMGYLTKKLARKAIPATETAGPGFEVTPQDARLVRVFPGLEFSAAQTYRFRVGFYDADTRNTLVLAYFDRPCHVSGTDTGNKDPTLPSPPQIDIQVDAPGWVWIEIRKTGPSAYVEDRVPSPHPVLLITPDDAALFRRVQEGTN